MGLQKDHSQQRLSRKTLRFVSPNVEAAFLRGRCEKMYLNLSRCCLICCAVMITSIVSTVSQTATGQTKPTDSQAEGLMTLYGWTAALNFVIAVSLRLPPITKHLGFCACEVLVFLLMLYLLVATLYWSSLVVTPDATTGGRGMGDEAMPLLRAFRTCTAALTLDAVLTVTHLHLPTRWIVMVWCDIIYAVAFVTFHFIFNESTMRQDISNVVVFASLAIGSSAGLWSQELSERTMFTVIVDERTLRAEAERQADGKGEEFERQRNYTASPPSETARSSVPSTTATGALFGAARSRNEFTGENIVALQALGRKEQWLIDDAQIEETGHVLGQGGQAVVVVGHLGKDLVAIKKPRRFMLHEQSLSSGDEQRATYSPAVWDELRILRHVRHPNIALFHGAVIQGEGDCGEGPVLLVMEIVAGVLLVKFLQANRFWESRKHDDAREAVMSGVCCALHYLHSRKPCVVHGDLKASNIHVETREAGPFAKLLDFGLARTVTRHNPGITGGTYSYMAPELLDPTGPIQRASTAVDVFALGKLLQIVTTGKKPGGALHHWKPSRSLSARWDSSIRKCTLHSPEARPRIGDVYDELFGNPMAFPRPRVADPVEHDSTADRLSL